jgi:predicted dinucleotide-binding enzyme
MNIGIIGAGKIGTTLARKFAARGHRVLIANSRGPETVQAGALETGARAVTAAEAVEGAGVVILSIPFNRIPDLAALVSALPADTVVIDTSNYFPYRDGRIEPVEQGQVESLWVAEQLGRPIVKAWNAVLSLTLKESGTPPGAPGRIALPVAADMPAHRKVGMALVDETGFDAFDAGPLSDSWRFQPGQPAYCTGLGLDALAKALAAADNEAPKRRDASIQRVIDEGGVPFGGPRIP